MRICFGSTMSNGRKSFRICRRTNLALRKDDRRILSGIMHVLKIGCRWQDCPKEYGPHKTIYNRFARWSERGVWQKIFESLAAPDDPPTQAALDSSHVKAHRCAHGGKGGAEALSRPLLTCDLICGPVAREMKKISYAGYRFPPEIIQQTIWL